MSDFTLEQLTESYKTEENVEKTPEQIAKEKRWAEEAESRRRNVYVPTDPNDGSDKEVLAANDEVRDMVIEFVKRYIRLQLEIKKIKEDIKALKKEFSEQGIPMKICTTAYNMVRKELKDNEGYYEEVAVYKEWMFSSKDVTDLITELDAK